MPDIWLACPILTLLFPPLALSFSFPAQRGRGSLPELPEGLGRRTSDSQGALHARQDTEYIGVAGNNGLKEGGREGGRMGGREGGGKGKRLAGF
jgi:hypothetical protein